MRYQTEIHVSPDRYVCLQLPTFFPEGRARVTVTFDREDGLDSESPALDEPDREDVEWWEELDDDRELRS
jgi:hypothetical protein